MDSNSFFDAFEIHIGDEFDTAGYNVSKLLSATDNTGMVGGSRIRDQLKNKYIPVGMYYKPITENSNIDVTVVKESISVIPSHIWDSLIDTVTTNKTKISSRKTKKKERK